MLVGVCDELLDAGQEVGHDHLQETSQDEEQSPIRQRGRSSTQDADHLLLHGFVQGQAEVLDFVSGGGPHLGFAVLEDGGEDGRMGGWGDMGDGDEDDLEEGLEGGHEVRLCDLLADRGLELGELVCDHIADLGIGQGGRGGGPRWTIARD